MPAEIILIGGASGVGTSSMAFELATYGLVASVAYRILPKKRGAIYVALLVAMISGRIVWGVARLVIAGVTANAFTWQMFLGGALLNAIPGIIIQLLLIPILMLAFEKSGVLRDGTN